MLKTLRTQTRWIMVTTLILIVPAFVLFYGWSSIQNQEVVRQYSLGRFQPADSTKWVEVDIPMWSFTQWSMRQEMLQQLFPMYGNNTYNLLDSFSDSALFPPKDLMIESVNQWALDGYAEELGVRLTDADVKARIAETFQGYPRETWPGILRAMELDEAKLGPYLAKQERLNRARSAIGAQVRASRFELWELYRLKNETVSIDYVAFDLPKYRANVAATDEDLTRYYAENMEDFRVGDQRRYRYAMLRRDSMADSVSVTEQDMETYYEEHAEVYAVPRSVKVRHILLSLDADSNLTPEEREVFTTQTLARALDIKRQLDEGAVFKDLANELSEDPANIDTADTTATTPRKLGGSIPGWISIEDAGRLGLAFVETATELDENEISDPVETRGPDFHGYSIIQCEGVKEAGVPPFTQVRHQVQVDALDQAVDRAWSEKTEDLSDQVTAYTTIDGVVADLGMEDGLTSWVLTSSEMLDVSLGSITSEDLDYINRDLQAGGQPSELLETTNYAGEKLAFVVQVIEEKPSHIPPLEDVRLRVERAYKEETGREAMRVAAEALRAAAVDADAFLAAATENGYEVRSPEPFKRDETPAPPAGQWIGFDGDSLLSQPGSVGLTLVGPAAETPSAYVVWLAKEMQGADPLGFEEALPEIRRDYVLAKRTSFLQEWLWDRREATEKRMQGEEE